MKLFGRWMAWMALAALCVFSAASQGVGAGDAQSTPGARRLAFRWVFPPGKALEYTVREVVRIQTETFDAKQKKWLKSKIQSRELSGRLWLKTIGDGNTHGILFLSVEKILEGKKYLPVKPEQMELQPAAQFVMNPKGEFESFQGASDKETYLFLRLLLGLPDRPLMEHEGVTLPFNFIRKKEVISMMMNGSVNFEYEGVNVRDGYSCVRIASRIDLTSDLRDADLPGRADWKGTGTLNFAVHEGRLQRADWRIGKEIETISGEGKSPTRIVTIYDIALVFITAQPLTE